MSRLRRQFFVLVPLLAWAAAGSPVQAQAAEQETRPANDAISATRRDLEALKSDRNLPMDSSKVALPTIDAPQIAAPTTLGPGAPLPPTAQSKPGQGQPRRSNSWLIDAMEGNSGENSLNGGANPKDPWQQLMLGDDSRDKAGRANGDSGSRLGLSNVEKDGILGDRRNLSRGTSSAADGKPELAPLKDAAPNPLAGYMAGWMTSRDFNLLAKPDTGGAPGSPEGISGSPITGATEAFSPSSAFFSAAVGGPVDFGSSRGSGPTGAPENPYLQALTQPPPSSTLPPALTLPPMSAPAPVSSVLPPLDNPAPPARLEFAHPELQKRDDDAKYFPQLKRF
jgi:hypothetical protein